ncbi:unnamed protein product [Bursaphelenchus okinawaensis]|uniref:Uncharacterized protein n=1 Tax=Bursaphelenchus okinawaensis TaxID=465554 RepID=A0A811KE67_9BILA|nr:unnamed protein product [Bursaphelenchus okinawaensis]CAG9099440.1 unnamed protein product [Bursaphelenchus okinawaensis]
MWLARVKALNEARLVNQQIRSLSTTQKTKKVFGIQWFAKNRKLTDAEAAVSQAPINTRAGAIDNPIYQTHTMSVVQEDDVFKGAWYRERPANEIKADRICGTIAATFFWAWTFYELYYRYEMFIGHFYIPYGAEFTDEELGIPPDDAPDPEYWGHHGQRASTYR